MENGFAYRAFISYRHKPLDIAAAKAIHTGLENYRVPAPVRKKTGLKKVGRCFRDREELPTSSDLAQDIVEALQNSEWLIVVCTPDTPHSKWCESEIGTFIRLHGRSRVLAVLAAGEPEDSFPDILRFETLPDGTRAEREPLAADVRAESASGMRRKLRTEKLRLLAPMLGVGFDDLRRRARERTLKIVVGASVSVALFFALFGGYALSQAATISRQNSEIAQKNDDLTAQIDETNRQKDLAQTNEAEAVKQAGIAKDNEARAVAGETEANRQAGIARDNAQLAQDNEAEALRQAGIAQTNEQLAQTNEAEANRQAGIAQTNEQEAISQKNSALISQSLFLSSLSQDRTAIGDTNTGVMLALAALPKDLKNPDRPLTIEAEAALRQSMFRTAQNGFVTVSGSRVGLVTIDYLYVLLSAKGHVLVTKEAIPYPTLEYSVYTGELLQTIDFSSATGYGVAYSPDGEYLAYLSDAVGKDGPDKDNSQVNLIGPDGKRWTIPLEGSKDYVTDFYFSPGTDDGIKLAICRGDSMDVYRLDNNKDAPVQEFHTVVPQGKQIYSFGNVVWSPDGNRMMVQYSPYENNDISILDSRTGEELFVLPAAENAVAWSADGKRFCTYTKDANQLWDADTLTQVPLEWPEEKAADLFGATFSPDGSKLAFFRGIDGSLQIFRASDGALLNTVSIPNADLSNLTLSWSGDGSMVLFTSVVLNSSQTVLVALDASGGHQVQLPDSSDKDVRFASFIPGTNDIAVIQYDGFGGNYGGTNELEFRVWRMADMRTNPSFSSIMPNGDIVYGPDSKTGLSWTPDGKYLRLKNLPGLSASGFGLGSWSADNPCKMCGLFDPLTFAPVNETPAQTVPLDYSPSGRRVLIFDTGAGSPSAFGIYDTQTKKMTRLLIPASWGTDYPSNADARFSPDETKVQYGAGIFDVNTGALLFELSDWLKDDILDDGDRLFDWSADSGRFACYSYTFNKNYTYTSHDSPGVYDASTFKKLFTLNDQGSVSDLAFSPDGKTIAVSSGYIYVYTAYDGDYNVETTDEFVKIYDAFTGDLIRKLPEDGGDGFYLRWSPDGKTLATLDDFGTTLNFYDTSTWTRMFFMNRQYSLPSFSADGSYFALPDGSLYSAATGKTLIEGWGEFSTNGQDAVSFSPTGQRYVLVVGDSLRVIDIEPLGTVMDQARRWMNGRQLSAEERSRYFIS